MNYFPAALLTDQPESSLPDGQVCNYVYDNESGDDFSTSDVDFSKFFDRH